MKIGIITFHFPYNCGAALQCLALQTKLRELGQEVNIINYRPWYHQNRYTALKNPVYYANKRFHDPADHIFKRFWHAADGFVRTVHSWKNYPQAQPKDKKFKDFAGQYLNQTKVYRSLKQLQNDPPACDLYIAGSDQLWNASITGGKLDPAYFLDFGGENTRRMSYSVGADFSAVKEPELALSPLVKRLDAISLREEKWLPVLETTVKGEKILHIDVDPTLLLKAEDYARYMPQLPEEKEPFILTYTMTGEAQKQVYNGAKILSEKLNMRVIDVSGNPGAMNKKVKDNRLCDPTEFLWYIFHADYVITNSFHGTVFAVLFQKQFVTIPHAVTGNRVTELLDKIDLKSRYKRVTQEAVNEITNVIDYNEPLRRLEKLRNESIEFLKENTK